VAIQRTERSNRRARQAWLAIALACTFSVSVPYLNGQPPKGNPSQGAADKSSPNRVRIRFTDQTPADTKETTQTASPGKLTADAARASVQQPNDLVGQSKPITVATQEEKNQKIAVDWSNPWAVFYITGKQSGYMEPCGCTGLENQKGGLNRRDTLLTSVRQRGWNVVPIDGGNQVGRFGRQSEIKYGWSAKAFNLMGYQATTYGDDDLQLDINSLLHPLINDDGKSSGLFVSANVSILPDFDVPFKVIQVGNRKVGITGVLGDENAKKVRNSDVSITPAVASLKKVAASLKAEKCDFQVLICHASLEESIKIVQAVPQFGLVITTGGFGEPTYRPEQVPGTECQMVQVGVKGMYAGLFGLFDDAKQPFRYQRIALSSQFEDSPRITELFGKYQDEIKAASFGGLGLRPVSHPTTREFVGSEKCGECHTTAFDIWSKTPHAHATDSIVEPPQRTMARHFDPECLSCHVTGWNPQKFFPYRTGYESLEATPHMTGNGCENCHGPGAKHAAVELGDLVVDAELRDKLRAEMRLPLERAQDKCTECHDADNSPDFHKDNAFEEYWAKVKHSGKD
jgi:hypothetical protein